MKVLILILLTVVALSDSATKKVAISRCCQNGQVGLIAGNTLMCSSEIVEEWKPTVYSKRKNTILERIPSSWTIIEANRPDCGNFNASLITKSYLLLESGSLFYNNGRISPDKFCVENDAALICIQDSLQELVQPSIQQAHVKKCCGHGGSWNLKKSSCVVSQNSSFQLGENQKFTILGGLPYCQNRTSDYAVVGPLENFNILEDGSLVSKRGETNQISAGAFCLENIIDEQDKLNVFTCAHDVLVQQTEQDNVIWILYPIGLLISVVFLIATLATGFILPSSHHVLHWRCQTNYVACLLVGDICLAISQLAGHHFSGGAFCLFLASMMHFFFLAAFFWLNTMCFNIWWTFRDIRPANLEKGQEACRLRLYEVYAWGVPVLIAGIAIILDNLPEDQGYEFLRPRFGHRTCWFFGDMELLTYFFGPIGVLLAINLVLFGLTARELTCGLWKREVVKSNTERAALGRVCLKLVVVMGVSWVADVISWIVGGPQSIWYVTDIINTLQGVFIFIVIGCQPQVWAAIKRLWCLRQSHVSGTTGNGNHHSSSSHGLPSLGDSVTNHTLTNTTNTNISCKSTLPLETSC